MCRCTLMSRSSRRGGTKARRATDLRRAARQDLRAHTSLSAWQFSPRCRLGPAINGCLTRRPIGARLAAAAAKRTVRVRGEGFYRHDVRCAMKLGRGQVHAKVKTRNPCCMENGAG